MVLNIQQGLKLAVFLCSKLKDIYKQNLGIGG